MRRTAICALVLLAGCGSSSTGPSERDIATATQTAGRVGLYCNTATVPAFAEVLAHDDADKVVSLPNGHRVTLRRVATDVAHMLDLCHKPAQAAKLRAALH